MIQILRDTLQQRLRQQPSFLLLLSRARLPAFGRLGLRLRLRFEIRRVSMRHSRSAICSLAILYSSLERTLDRVEHLRHDQSCLTLRNASLEVLELVPDHIQRPSCFR
jgi:hypothetical protein